MWNVIYSQNTSYPVRSLFPTEPIHNQYTEQTIRRRERDDNYKQGHVRAAHQNSKSSTATRNCSRSSCTVTHRTHRTAAHAARMLKLMTRNARDRRRNVVPGVDPVILDPIHNSLRDAVDFNIERNQPDPTTSHEFHCPRGYYFARGPPCFHTDSRCPVPGCFLRARITPTRFSSFLLRSCHHKLRRIS